MTPEEMIEELNTELVEMCSEKIGEFIGMHLRDHKIEYDIDSSNVMRITIDNRTFSLRPNFEECPF